jgi:hypothetical protein
VAGSKGRPGRFAPGQSGHLQGRPRRDKPMQQEKSAFDVLDGRQVSVVMGGMPRELTLLEALFYKTYQEALAGGRMAIRAVLKKIMAREARQSPRVLGFPLILMENPDPADVDDALVALGIATRSEERTRPEGRPFLQLQPWAVTAALRRPKLGLFSRQSLKDIREQTRDADTVTWPEEDE